MRAEETPEEGTSGHRRLPSVNMPLLREQRRVTRVKQIAALVVLVVCVVGAITAAIVYRIGGGEDGEQTPPTLAAAAATPGDGGPRDGGTDAAPDAAPPTELAAGEPRTPGAVSREVRRFGSAKGFRHALQKAGLDNGTCAELEEALGDVMDFRRCRPEDEMVLEHDTEGRLVLFEYHGGGPVEFVRATRSAAGEMVAELVKRPVETRRLAKGGRVTSSLGDALVRVGLGRKLVGSFLGVFDGRVNFSTDTRKGDVFRIIVDEKRLDGELLRWGRVHALEYVGKRTGELRAFWFAPREGEGDFWDESGRSMSGWLRDPCRYDRISSRYDPNRMHPILKRVVPHNGVDYAAGRGTPVWAAADGTVTFAGRKGANGNLVAIRHRDGYKSFYAHLQRIERGIDNGTDVEQKQVIGYVGSTGRSTGPHLHFGLKRHGRFVDPMDQLNGKGRRMRPAALGRYKRHVRKLRAELAAIEVSGEPPAEADEEPAEPAEPADEPMD